MNLSEFFNTYGFYGNADNIYESTILKIQSKLQTYLRDIRINKRIDIVRSSIKNPIMTEETPMIDFKVDEDIILSIPELIDGHFIIEGIEKVSLLIDVIQPYVGSLMNEKNKRFKFANKLTELRYITGRFNNIIVFEYSDKIYVYLNNLVAKENFKKGSINECIDPLVLLKLIMDNSSIDSIISDISSYCSVPIRHMFNIPNSAISFDENYIRKYIADTFQNLDENKLRTRLSKFYSEMTSKESFYHTICYMIASVIKNSPEINTDTMMMKRFDCYGSLLLQKITGYFKALKVNEYNTLEGLFKVCSNFQNILYKELKSGKIQTRYVIDTNKAIQTLSRKSEIDTISHKRRIKTIINTGTTNVELRGIDRQAYGFICPFETPESKEVGLTKYLALTCLITDYCNETELLKFVDKSVHTLKSENIPLFINNFYYTSINAEFVRIFRNFKSRNDKYKFCSISLLNQAIYIYTDIGRLVRPILYYGNIMYVDYYEQCSIILEEGGIGLANSTSNAREISDIYFYGLAASLAPFSNHSQTTRISYQTSITKQAIEHNIKILERNLNDTTFLWIGENPICYTSTSKFVHSINGVNVNVAIIALGNNQEDAIILNEDSVRQGLFATTKIKTKFKTIRKGDGIFINASIHNTHQLNSQGIILPNQYVKKGDYLFGTYENNSQGNIKITRYYSTTDGYIHSTNIYENEYYISVYIVIHYTNYLQVGDKLASRYSQKGVVSSIEKSWNLPYTEKGEIPDLIINSHAIPSRMTTGHLIETVLGRFNLQYDSTPFTFNINDLDYSEIEKSEVQMFHPLDGTPIHNKIFFGKCFYQASKHQVKDKIQSRSMGANSILTKQPIEGKSKGGGLRLGEMEKDALLAYQAYDVIAEKFTSASDGLIAPCCKKCGAMFTNRICCNEDIDVIVPYSFKLVQQTLGIANVKIGGTYLEYSD